MKENNRLSLVEAYALIDGLTDEEKEKLLVFLEELILQREKQE